LADLGLLSLYEGQGNANIVVNARRATPSYSLRAELTGLDALPFLQAAAGFDRLRGTGTLELNFTTSGDNQAAIMEGLDGRGNFSFADGAIVGINIAETIRNVSDFVSGNGNASGDGESSTAETGDTAETDFTALTGSFTATSGRVTNEDLLMLSPLLRVTGGGWVNLPEQALDYRLQPRAVASIQGQGGDRDMQGITVPVRIRGSFNNVSIGVDTEAVGQALLTGALTNALGGNGNTASTPREAVRDTLLNALGISNNESAPADPDAEQPAEPEDPAQQLLRGLRNLGRAPQPEPEPEPEPEPTDPQDGNR
jgi:AsmA protein